MNTKNTNPQSAPPAAYAAFVRICIGWMTSAEITVGTVERSVRAAQKAHSRLSSVFPVHGPFGARGSMLYGKEFDEYVNEVWIEFSEEFPEKHQDVDEFAIYLQKDFEKKLAKQNEAPIHQRTAKRNRFFNKMMKKIDDVESAIESMSDDEADQYLAEKEKEINDEVKRWMDNEWDTNYASLEELLSRSAERIMSRQQYASKKAQGMVSLVNGAETDGEDEAVFSIENVKSYGLPFEEVVAALDVIERTKVTLSDQDKLILIF